MLEKYKDIESAKNIYEYAKAMEWDKWCKEIPAINFPTHWSVKIIPPFNNAIVRFMVYYNEKHASVYLDCYDLLGLFGSPYWEIYPYNEDVYRVAMNDVDELYEALRYVLEES